MSYNSGIRVLFLCRLCAHSFDQVSHFIAHKKEYHFQEFQRTTCIVFEDKPIPNSSASDGYVDVECSGSLPLSSVVVKLETFDDATSNLELEQEPKPQSQEFIATQPHFEVISTKIEMNEDGTTLEHEIHPQEYKNPVVLLKRISSKKIQNLTDDANHSFKESDEESGNIEHMREAPHSATKVDDATNVLTCKLCHKSFSSDPQLRIHVQTCLLYNNNKANSAYCPKCNNFFANIQQLQDHIESCHVNKPRTTPVAVSFRKKSGTKSNLLPISVSENSAQNLPRKAFESLDRLQESFDLDNHNIALSEPDPLTRKIPKGKINLSNFKCFKCPFPNCQRVFKMNNLLQSHIRTHTGERPFKCPVPNCGKAFTHRGTLYNHKTETHSDSSSFKCPHSSCNHIFKAKRSVRMHYQTFHEQSQRRKPGWPKK